MFIEAFALVCLAWYILIIIVSCIGYIQLYLPFVPNTWPCSDKTDFRTIVVLLDALLYCPNARMMYLTSQPSDPVRVWNRISTNALPPPCNRIILLPS
jgi:hypothetical protein